MGETVNELVLHVGSRKTGTSSLQSFLAANRDLLAERGVLCPTSPGKARHVRIGLSVLRPEQATATVMWPRMKADDPIAFRRHTRRRLLEECVEAGLPRVVLSDELLFGLEPDGLARLRDLGRSVAARLRVVVYLRRQDQHLLSNYQQAVKSGETRRLLEWSRLDHSATYDYARQLHAWQENVAPEVLRVRRFEPPRFVGRSLHLDFLDAAGIDATDADWEIPSDRNQSLPAESVEFLRIWNLHRVEHTGATPGSIDNRTLHRQLTGPGPALSLPPQELDRFQELWTQSNDAVAQEFFRDQGDLFVADSSRRDVTTDQRLEPGRLAHYLELLEIDSDAHASLTRICQREAALTSADAHRSS